MTPAPNMLHWKLGRKPPRRFYADVAVKARPYIKAAVAARRRAPGRGAKTSRSACS
jgi:hypothetical protein